MGKIGYRAGDLGHKAEDVTQLVDRGTGYFGTGYYFTTEPERCMMQGKAQQRPLYRLTFKDDVNWLTGTIRLHEDLKDFHRYMFMYSMYRDEKLLKQLCEFATAAGLVCGYDRDFGDMLESEWDYYQYEYDTKSWDEFCDKYYPMKSMLAVADECSDLKEFAHLLRTCDAATGKPDFESISNWKQAHLEYFDDERMRDYKRTADRKRITLPINFNITREQFDEICSDIYELYKDDYSGGMFRPWRRRNELTGLDSFPTLLVKALGYDGIWPSEECDNISYGGIIYNIDDIMSCDQIAAVATDWGK
jgi:hypothetical protein